MIPFKDVPDIGHASKIASLAIPDPYEVIVHLTGGKTTEIAWDFACHCCDAGYEPRIRAVAAHGRGAIGARIRTLRESAGLTQAQLAARAGIGRVSSIFNRASSDDPWGALKAPGFRLPSRKVTTRDERNGRDVRSWP